VGDNQAKRGEKISHSVRNDKEKSCSIADIFAAFDAFLKNIRPILGRGAGVLFALL